MQRVASFEEIREGSFARVNWVVYCSMATVDPRGRPRSRLVHPVWTVEGGALTGWVTGRRHDPKAIHLASTPYASFCYVAEMMTPLAVECRAGWVDDPDERLRVWEVIEAI